MSLFGVFVMKAAVIQEHGGLDKLRVTVRLEAGGRFHLDTLDLYSHRSREHFAQAAANKLTHSALDPVSGIPEFKVCAVKLSKAA